MNIQIALHAELSYGVKNINGAEKKNRRELELVLMSYTMEISETGNEFDKYKIMKKKIIKRRVIPAFIIFLFLAYKIIEECFARRIIVFAMYSEFMNLILCVFGAMLAIRTICRYFRWSAQSKRNIENGGQMVKIKKISLYKRCFIISVISFVIFCLSIIVAIVFRDSSSYTIIGIWGTVLLAVSISMLFQKYTSKKKLGIGLPIGIVIMGMLLTTIYLSNDIEMVKFEMDFSETEQKILAEDIAIDYWEVEKRNDASFILSVEEIELSAKRDGDNDKYAILFNESDLHRWKITKYKSNLKFVIDDLVNVGRFYQSQEEILKLSEDTTIYMGSDLCYIRKGNVALTVAAEEENLTVDKLEIIINKFM